VCISLVIQVLSVLIIILTAPLPDAVTTLREFFTEIESNLCEVIYHFLPGKTLKLSTSSILSVDI